MNQKYTLKNIAVRLLRVAIKFSKNDQNFVEVEKINILLPVFALIMLILYTLFLID